MANLGPTIDYKVVHKDLIQDTVNYFTERNFQTIYVTDAEAVVEDANPGDVVVVGVKIREEWIEENNIVQ